MTDQQILNLLNTIRAAFSHNGSPGIQINFGQRADMDSDEVEVEVTDILVTDELIEAADRINFTDEVLDTNAFSVLSRVRDQVQSINGRLHITVQDKDVIVIHVLVPQNTEAKLQSHQAAG